MNLERAQSHGGNKTSMIIRALQDELAATNQEVLLMTLEFEERVAERTAQLSNSNQALKKEIAQRSQAEKKVKKLNETLVRRAALLEASNQELEAFSYSVSHDLRAPLRHISGYAAMLKEEASGLMNDPSLRYLAKIINSAAKMNVLIDDLLLFARMGRKELQCGTVDLNKLVADIIRELEPDMQQRNIEWKISELPIVHGDQAMLRQVLVNLLSNAIKYTRPRHNAQIQVDSQNSDVEVVIFVRDNGVGFDQKYASNLFGVFQRLHGEDAFEGTGVGLANVRRIIMRHHGKVWAEAKVDEGATFYFSLPFTDEENE